MGLLPPNHFRLTLVLSHQHERRTAHTDQRQHDDDGDDNRGETFPFFSRRSNRSWTERQYSTLESTWILLSSSSLVWRVCSKMTSQMGSPHHRPHTTHHSSAHTSHMASSPLTTPRNTYIAPRNHDLFVCRRTLTCDLFLVVASHSRYHREISKRKPFTSRLHFLGKHYERIYKSENTATKMAVVYTFKPTMQT